MAASPQTDSSEQLSPSPELAQALSVAAGFPRRIICLTDETTETLYLLGEQERIVGVSAYAMRPAEARNKPRVSAFKSANFNKILESEAGSCSYL